MSARHYRKVAAIALVASVGLAAASCSSGKSGDSAGKTTIVVDCPPLKTDNHGKSLDHWNSDVANFEKIHPDIVIKTVSVGAQCDNPPDFTARLQGGTQADIFYAYMTDLNQVLDVDAAMDISQYINTDTVPNWDSLQPAIKTPFQDGGKTYGIGYAGYTMGLVYNKKLFTQANITTPPATWQDVAADAKKIAALGSGIAGYSDYSAGNTGGWHFTAEIYSRGGADVSSDGKTATVNTPEGQAVLANLKSMRFTDNSMGAQQLLTWPDLLTNAGAGKVGMYIGAPDTITAIVTSFKGSYEDWAMAPMPGDSGPAKGTLGGGSGYFFKKGLTADQVKAGLEWISYEELTPGQGQFDYVSQKALGLPVGLPEPLIWTPGSPLQKQDQSLKQANTTLNLADYAAFANNPVKTVTEPPNAQGIYAILDGAMSAVLTQPNADPAALLTDAQTKIQSLLTNGS
jgi:ABC-type glycerol-3-phosphate transport system substrate-binding protein